MAYKKYIRKNGKLYGPYTYHSRRVDGKVVSEYHGKDEKSYLNKYQVPKINLSKNLVLIVIGALFLITIGLFVYNISIKNLTGNVALDLQTKYSENENLQGNFILKLKEGEFVPANSKIIIDTSSQKYEYILSDLVANNVSTGNFYIENSQISGAGSGFGKEGVKKIPQELTFTIKISSQKKSEDKTDTKPNANDSPNETQSNDQPVSDTPADNETAQPVDTVNDETTNSDETVNDIPQDNTQTTTDTTGNTDQPTNNAESQPASDTTGNSNGNSDNSPASDSTGNSNGNSDNSPSSDTTITGNIVGGFLRSVSNFFLGLNPSRGLTGQVSLELQDTIDGETSSQNSFTYTLEDGQIATLKEGSVKLKSSGESISDNDISLKQNGNEVTITTDYSSSEKGYGSDYITENIGEELTVDLESLNIPAEKGKLTISVNHEDQSIVSVSKELNVQGKIEITSNETQVIVDQNSFGLTPGESEILSSTFENLTIKTTKAISENDRLKLRYQLNKYWIEYSYNYDGDLSKISDLIERDKSRWLKDIAQELIKKQSKSSPENIDGLLENEFNLSSIKTVTIITDGSNATTEDNIVENTNETQDEAIVSENITTQSTNNATLKGNETIITEDQEVAENNSVKEVNVSS
ncbi:hypothetical protein COU57_05735 [Candidatus Pacearchaeota archaeon CG10_big_fil_rev_8_21_14_0_10_32_14]|nr:MAG: hypothetical protein COU57_05735 [Candidatus Pacearchaeota archaeon CG10_big_fil_rev_8_21_14_0_10_32_14]